MQVGELIGGVEYLAFKFLRLHGHVIGKKAQQIFKGAVFQAGIREPVGNVLVSKPVMQAAVDGITQPLLGTLPAG